MQFIAGFELRQVQAALASCCPSTAKKLVYLLTLPETNMDPENGTLRDVYKPVVFRFHVNFPGV